VKRLCEQNIRNMIKNRDHSVKTLVQKNNTQKICVITEICGKQKQQQLYKLDILLFTQCPQRFILKIFFRPQRHSVQQRLSIILFSDY
jgi:ATP-dependent phosphoenolpyruvate carboxykinase